MPQGAIGDGASLDTAAIQAAIDACGKEATGGVVVLEANHTYLTGTLRIPSNVRLHVPANATLLAAMQVRPLTHTPAVRFPRSALHERLCSVTCQNTRRKCSPAPLAAALRILPAYGRRLVPGAAGEVHSVLCRRRRASRRPRSRLGVWPFVMGHCQLKAPQQKSLGLLSWGIAS